MGAWHSAGAPLSVKDREEPQLHRDCGESRLVLSGPWARGRGSPPAFSHKVHPHKGGLCSAFGLEVHRPRPHGEICPWLASLWHQASLTRSKGFDARVHRLLRRGLILGRPEPRLKVCKRASTEHGRGRARLQELQAQND